MSLIDRTPRRVLFCSGALITAVVLLGSAPWQLVAANPQGGTQQNSQDVIANKMTLAEYEAIPTLLHPSRQGLHRMDAGSYGLVFSNDEKGDTRRIAGVNKNTGEWKWLKMPKNSEILFDPIMGDDVTAFIQHGNPLTKLIVYNAQLNKWSTYSLSLQDRVIDVIPCVGDRMVCYQLKDRVVAYSAIRDSWAMILTKDAPALGDDSVLISTTKGRYMFPDHNGGWAIVKSPTN